MDGGKVKKKARADGASSSSAAAGVPAKKHKPSGGGGAIPPASMNPAHTAPGAVEAYAAAFKAGSPFPHIFLRDMFAPGILAAVKQELLGGTYFRKRNDLYDFAQTDDLKRASGNATAALREYIYSPAFREWIGRVTGVPVNDTLDASAASYTKGSYLLCHDDDLSERRIAWIIYLVPEGWDEADGGALDLFDLADPADPTVPGAVVRSLTPAWNSMAFFEVSAASHHQVAEVLDDTKGPRLSISGWFHGPPLARPPMKPLPSPTFISPSPPEDDEEGGDDADSPAAPSPKIGPPLSNAKLRDGSSDALTEWVNPAYLRPSVLAAMRAQFARDASLEVADFLRPDRYAEVMRSLGTQRWDFRGPANAACYRACYDTSAAADGAGAATAGGACVTGSTGAYNGILPDPVHRLWRFATGWQFQALVSALTGQPLDGVSGEVRCFTAGDYTMLLDPEYRSGLVQAKRERIGAAPSADGSRSSSSSAAGAGGGKKKSKKGAAASSSSSSSSAAATPQPRLVDATLLCVLADEWEEDAGGYTSYLTSDEELLTVVPKQNRLVLVQREPGVMSFVKFVTHSAAENRYDVALQFLVAEPGDEEGDDDE